MVLNFAILILVVTVFVRQGTCNYCYNGNFIRIDIFDNKIMSGLSLWSKSGTGSAMVCSNECAHEKQCMSFFYNTQTDVCTGHTVRYTSIKDSTTQQGSVYFTLLLHKRECSEVRTFHPHSPDGVYIINPEDGEGVARVYCDMPVSVGVWTTISDCTDIKSRDPNAPSGVYFVNPNGGGHFRVYCDMTTGGGGWTVFQRREDGSVDFYKYWADYKAGFGNAGGEFWLGFENIRRIISGRATKLRLDMKDQDDQSGYATYSTFIINDEADGYRLTVHGYDGNRGDSLNYHNGMMFSTRDRDQDLWSGVNCAESYSAAWWYNKCTDSHLNGGYGLTSYGSGITWYSWHGASYSLKWVEMKMEPA